MTSLPNAVGRTASPVGGAIRFAASYDPVEVLAAFGEEHAIGFPMLGDEGSHMICRLGLLNDIPTEQASIYGVTFRPEYFGVPHPGTFVINEEGFVIDRWFEQSYRVRSSGAVVVERLLGRVDNSAAVTARAAGTGVAMRAWLSDAVYRPWVETMLYVDIAIEPGLHLCAQPVPNGFQALEVTVSPQAGLFAGAAPMPPGSSFRMVGFDDPFIVYEGRVRVDVSLSLIENKGPAGLGVAVCHQVCDESGCFVPETAVMHLTIVGADHDRSVPSLPDGG